MVGRKKGRNRCWTCRLRRKKCDGTLPVCNACAALEIDCHRGENKPDWMDGSTAQREMAEGLKSRIKTGAAGRRQRQALEGGSTTSRGRTEFIVTLQKDFASDEPAPDTTGEALSEGESSFSEASASQVELGGVSEPFSGAPGCPAHLQPQDLAETETLLAMDLADRRGRKGGRSPVVSLGRAWELDFVMIYLDYVFPFLFPFYHPPLIGTGRAWLLTFVKQSDAVFHSVISLSSYFFVVGLNCTHPGKHENCKALVWDHVLKQADLSFETIQEDLKGMGIRGLQATLLEKARLMESIIQLLIFDAFLGRSADWDVHLSPALILFTEILEQHSGASSSTKTELLSVLEAMTWQAAFNVDFGRPIWNPDQAAFRFFTATLIFLDIVASTSLGRNPRLSSYHSHIVADLKPDEVGVPIDLSAFFGCQNWALLAVGRVSSLNAWKKNMKKSSSLAIPDLAERANSISQDLAAGLVVLDGGTSFVGNTSSRLQPHYHNSQTISAQLSGAAVTRLWAHAARVYLVVVASGWQPSNAEIRHDVAQILALLRPITDVAQLCAVAWPICVGGCLAESETEEREFRSIVTSMGDQQALSSLREAQEIMEAVWRNRNDLDCATWDLEACFRILGRPPLLV